MDNISEIRRIKFRECLTLKATLYLPFMITGSSEIKLTLKGRINLCYTYKTSFSCPFGVFSGGFRLFCKVGPRKNAVE